MSLLQSHFVKENDPLLVALHNQHNVIKSIVAYTGNWYSLPAYLMEKKYHAVQFDVKENLKECKKFAMTFSKYPDIYLSDVRNEIQFDNLSLTMSINHWVRCGKLTNGLLIGYEIEYYIHTVENFPVMIFFRISKAIEDHKQKLDAFINAILERNTYIEWNDLKAIDHSPTNDVAVFHGRKRKLNHKILNKITITYSIVMILTTVGCFISTNQPEKSRVVLQYSYDNITVAPRILYSSEIYPFVNKNEIYPTT